MNSNTALSYVLLVILVLLSGCAQNPVTGGTDFVLMSEKEEIAMGLKEHPKLLKKYGEYDNRQLQEYVSRVGQRVAANSHRGDLKYTFTLLDSSDVNAFALPGGYIYITRGLLAYLNSEAELAAVLGHEIGHVTARHSVRRISAAKATQFGLVIGSLFLPEAGRGAAMDMLNILGSALIQGYGREHELEADRLGAEYLARTGYDAQAMIGVIRVLKNQELFEKQLAREEKREPRIYHGVFASHPDNDTRLQQVVAEAEKYKGRKVVHSNDRTTFIRRQDGLVFGSSAREGIVHKNSFYHRDLGIAMTFPEGWKLKNNRESLLATAPNKVAALQMTLARREQQESAKELLFRALKLEQLKKGEPVAIDGGGGYTGLAPIRSGLTTYQGRVTAVVIGENGYILMGVADKKENFPNHDKKFLATARSLHALREHERGKAEPLMLDVVRVRQGDTFARLSKGSPVHSHAETQLRLLNDNYPKGEPKAGSWIKVVE